MIKLFYLSWCSVLRVHTYFTNVVYKLYMKSVQNEFHWCNVIVNKTHNEYVVMSDLQYKVDAKVELWGTL